MLPGLTSWFSVLQVGPWLGMFFCLGEVPSICVHATQVHPVSHLHWFKTCVQHEYHPISDSPRTPMHIPVLVELILCTSEGTLKKPYFHGTATRIDDIP